MDVRLIRHEESGARRHAERPRWRATVTARGLERPPVTYMGMAARERISGKSASRGRVLCTCPPADWIFAQNRGQLSTNPMRSCHSKMDSSVFASKTVSSGPGAIGDHATRSAHWMWMQCGGTGSGVSTADANGNTHFPHSHDPCNCMIDRLPRLARLIPAGLA